MTNDDAGTPLYLLLLRRYALIGLSLVAIATGVAGHLELQRTCGPLDLWDLLNALYRTLQSFGLNFEPADCSAGTGEPAVGALLQVSRFLAFLVAAFAVISVFFNSAWNDLLLWAQVRWRDEDRMLLLGFGQVNFAIALAEKKARPRLPVTVVDRSFDPAQRRLGRDLGIRMIEGELSDPHTMRRVRPDRAQRVVVALGDDIRTVEVATMVAPLVESGIARRMDKSGQRAGERPPGQTKDGQWPLRAHISDPALLGSLTEARDLSNRRDASFQPFNLRIAAATRLAYRADLVQRARDHGQQRVHLVIVGLGHQGEAILIETLFAARAADLKPPKITVLDRNAKEVEARMRASYPRLMENRAAAIRGPQSPDCEGWCPIEFRSLDVELTDFTSDPLLLGLDGPDVADWPTAWVFSCGDDCRNQAAALRLEIAMQQCARRSVPIFARLWGSGLQPETQSNRHPFGLVEYFGASVETVASSHILSADQDALARAIHAAYQAVDKPLDPKKPVTSATDRFRQDWLDLPENMREANRRPARHIGFKIRDLGFDWRGFRLGVRPCIAKDRVGDLRRRIAAIRLRAQQAEAVSSVQPPASLFLPEDKPFYEAALLEHTLWSVHRVSNGWIQGPNGLRNNIYRHHDCIRPFVELGPITQGYDLMALDTGLAAAASKRPTAVERSVLRVLLDDPDLPVFTGHTQVELVVDPTRIPDQTRLDALSKALVGWATARDSTACRLHIILTDQVVLPPDRDRGHKDSLAIRALSRALLRLPDDLTVDVTRKYAPCPVPPRHAAPE